MSFSTSKILCIAIVSALTAACSGGLVSVGKTEQQLKTKKDGTPTGNGTSCSWVGTDEAANYPERVAGSEPGYPGQSGGTTPSPGGGVNGSGPGQNASDLPANTPGGTGGDTPVSSDDPNGGNSSSNPSGKVGYSIGENFKSPDGCNDCQCSSKGIMCTMRACSSPPNPGGNKDGGPIGCPLLQRICKDGSNAKPGAPGTCDQICPEDTPRACTDDARQCPDGTYVGRTGPNCEFVCPEPVACPADAKQCPDGSYVVRTGPKCEFAPCP
jgi:hypothetical protein